MQNDKVKSKLNEEVSLLTGIFTYWQYKNLNKVKATVGNLYWSDILSYLLLYMLYETDNRWEESGSSAFF